MTDTTADTDPALGRTGLALGCWGQLYQRATDRIAELSLLAACQAARSVSPTVAQIFLEWSDQGEYLTAAGCAWPAPRAHDDEYDAVMYAIGNDGYIANLDETCTGAWTPWVEMIGDRRSRWSVDIDRVLAGIAQDGEYEPQVTCLQILHRHGANISVHLHEASADRAIVAYVDQWWDDEVKEDGEPMPRPSNPERMVEYYFEHVEDEAAMKFPVPLLTDPPDKPDEK